MGQIGEQRGGINPVTGLAIPGPTFSRTFVSDERCEQHVGHKHNYDHTTVICRGRALLTISEEKLDGSLEVIGEREYAEFAEIPVKARLHHTIKDVTPPISDRDKALVAEVCACPGLSSEAKELVLSMQKRIDSQLLAYKCMYPHRDFNGLVSQDFTGNGSAYV